MAVISKTGDVTTEKTPDQTEARPPAWRSVAIGMALIPLSTYFGNYSYVVVQALLWGQTSLLRGPVFMLFLLALVNLGLRKMSKKFALQPWEMLVIYSMLAISVCVSGFGMLQFLINILPAGSYFANSNNHYERFLHYVPKFLVPSDPKVIKDFYLGGVSVYRADILQDWATPTIVWSVFIGAMCWVTLCITSLVRRQWTDGEKLAFPLVQLPLEMAQAAAGKTNFFQSRTMWAGFLIAGFLESINYLNYFYPTLPYIQIKPFHIEALITTPPWNGVGTLTSAFYPFAIGIAFLLSLEVSFSCWFFYLLTKVENVAVVASGLSAGGGGAHGGLAQAPFLGEQGIGAFIALALVLLWRVRKSLFEAMRSAWDQKLALSIDDPDAPISPRVAFWSGLVGMVCLTAFVTVMGLPLWVSIGFWVIYFLFILVVTRIIAEAGTGWAYGPMVPVHGMLIEMAGTNAIGDRALTNFGMLSWFEVEYRDSPMPHQLEAMKMAQETNTPRKALLWGLILAGTLSAFIAFWAYLHMYYEFGAASAKVRPALAGLGPTVLSRVDDWLRNPRLPDTGGMSAMAAGAVIILALTQLRQTFVWWPLHPIGYALAGTTSMEYMWCPFLVGWLIKSIVIRYGGIKMYRSMLPFFLGLILGDYVVPTLWGLWGTTIHTQVYMAFPH